MNSPKIVLFSLIALLLSSCVVTPTVKSDYDEECQIVKKQIVLSVEQVQMFHGMRCSGNEQCKAQFLGQVTGAAVAFPLSAAISGSIAVVGNTIYWISEQGKC